MLSLGQNWIPLGRCQTQAISQMVDTLTSERFHQPILNFVKLLKEEDPNAEFWWDYMVMVSILLYFTRAQHDGVWELHQYAFRRMLSIILQI